MYQLFKLKGFLPFIIIVFLNAFVDLGHKIIIQNTIFKIWDGETQVILTAIVNALILLPFILLFSPSGFMSDRFPKHLIIRFGSLAVVVLTALISVCYFMGWFWAAFSLTFLLAVQSAIYSPAKYGYLREMVAPGQLAQGNGLAQAVAIVAILAGTFVFSAFFEMLIPKDYETTSDILVTLWPLGLLLVSLASIEFLASFLLEKKYAGDASKTFTAENFLKGRYLKENLTEITSHKAIIQSIIGLATFWSISQVILAAFPAYAKETLAEENTLIIQGLLAFTGIGIMIGSMIAGRISRRYIDLGLVPVGAVGISLMLIAVTCVTNYYVLASVFVLLGICAGIFIVPLNALIQFSADKDKLGVVLAGNNWVQNIAMLSFLVITMLMASAGFAAVNFFYLLAVIALIGALYTVYQLPHSLARIFGSLIFRRLYGINVIGFENIPREGGVLLLGNHISWIDWALVQIACPRAIRFVMIRSIYEQWYLKPFFKIFGVIPISAGNSKKSLQQVNEYLKKGEVVCIFPEGAISRTGHLGEFKTGYERAVEDVDALIVPFYLHGLWGSQLSYSKSEKLRNNTSEGVKRGIKIAFGEPISIETKASELKQKVFELSIDAWERYSQDLDVVPLAWLKEAKKQLRKTSLVDSNGTTFSNRKVIAATLAMADYFEKHSKEATVGIMLPASSAAIMANLALMLKGKTVVNINYSASPDSVNYGLNDAEVKTVYTSKKLLAKMTARGIDVDAMLKGLNVILLEDVKETFSKIRLLRNLICAYALPARWLYKFFGVEKSIDDRAQILFSSGSEGKPKGIELNYRNIMGNIKQISNMLNLQENDVIMASLPPFHSFGLTVTSLMPMVEGVPAVCHPDPTDALGISKAVARFRATIMCGTASFLRLYVKNRRVQPLMLDSLRVVVAGAEKLTDDVRNDFELKFRKPIYEGYGATETTPVATVNVPDKLEPSSWKTQLGQKHGTVGMPLPGSCIRIVNPASFETMPIGEAGMVLISGGQVMMSYLNNPEKTAEVVKQIDGRRWYVTGDKGFVDKDGFLTIVDRYSRFAKLAGEMVSLTDIEQRINQQLALSGGEILAVNLPDAKKGEKIVLLVAGYAVEDIESRLAEVDLTPLMVPSAIYSVEAIPKLGSGKTNFSEAKKLALTL